MSPRQRTGNGTQRNFPSLLLLVVQRQRIMGKTTPQVR
uniref:Uncharacterized protein n=1 Tax=Anguilla anguilla TaxID=7936 RepID=A0A0E9VKA8_ANGAN